MGSEESNNICAYKRTISLAKIYIVLLVKTAMLRYSRLCFPKMGCEEITRKARRVQLQPTEYLAQHRMQVWQLRFKEMGPPFSRVWVALGGKMRRRRVGRQVDVKDMRYYWRPIEPQYQRLYMSRLRIRDHSNKLRQPMRLRATNADIGSGSSSIEWERASNRKYGAMLAPPKRQDFEFRVV
ncbi:hypothetical protein, conserved [Trypanosoma brucei gambiense DAL972]|uniref:Uncharacterized protein n=3 Tax=Trypanosoma brucei TaxID=5691 RepID=D0A1K1_TRYB9|nr:hypothetical protein, conserved [Trypanosoma brucei gambiense DAL972]6HIV_A8 Chain A8, bL35m [Trypanosoma brucei brucei]6HIX_A8 Chain A8, bl35m [Trypanosoma brucei brucei]6YXX_A8 Chain A8, bL35m [Trypanosoma brucei brucei]6YXY_A8 Chain A8, bL35m [Trypanosoma brucei brucei]RHW69101.1 hypothetical protein DPX39_100023700 [Trypanosoma brucei equiperdum]CBH15143.1 hypothetical protein, conserved [Trypanosoma brucei gambiense DAL972]|eukprot:XP_011777409.1 hypothetical protein, conserved [Trypanosoma brucei gambiense DAL972]